MSDLTNRDPLSEFAVKKLEVKLLEQPLLSDKEEDTINYEEMCDLCQEWYRDQYSGSVVIDFLIVCCHKRIK